MDVLASNLAYFIDALPASSIVIVYLGGKSQTWEVKERFHRLLYHGNTYYVNRGSVGHWAYVYQLSQLTYLFTRVDTTVQAFVGRVTHAKVPPEQDGGSFQVGHVGSHLSVGIVQKKGKLWLNTHETAYVEDEEKPFEFEIDASLECEVEWSAYDGPRSICKINKRVPTKQTLAQTYADTPEWVSIIDLLYQAASRKSYYLDNAAHPVEVGMRGGKYIQHQGKRRYIGAQVGGALRRPLTEDVIRFVHAELVGPVVDACRQRHLQDIGAMLLYDEGDEFQSTTSRFVLIYDIANHRTRRIFYLDADQVFRACADFLQQTNTPRPTHASTCLAQFRALRRLHESALAVL
jgi:hypothetical protein